MCQCDNTPLVKELVFHARSYVRFVEIKSNFGRKKLYRTNLDYNFLAGNFNNEKM